MRMTTSMKVLGVQGKGTNYIPGVNYVHLCFIYRLKFEAAETESTINTTSTIEMIRSCPFIHRVRLVSLLVLLLIY